MGNRKTLVFLAIVLSFGVGVMTAPTWQAGAFNGGDIETLFENPDVKGDSVSVTIDSSDTDLFVAVLDKQKGLRVLRVPTSGV